MPTDKPRLTFALDEETFKALEEYRYTHRVKNQSQAIVSLIEKGLDSLQPILAEQKKESSAPEGVEDKPLISMERSDRLYDALVASGLITDDSLAPEDLRFLMHVADLIEDWFTRKQAQ